jgi:hypothetical protein
LSPEQNPQLSLKQRLVIFYKQRAPDKLGNVDMIIAKFAGRESELWEKLYDMYPDKIVEDHHIAIEDHLEGDALAEHKQKLEEAARAERAR